MRQEEILVDSMLNMFAALELATVRIGDDPQLDSHTLRLKSQRQFLAPTSPTSSAGIVKEAHPPCQR